MRRWVMLGALLALTACGAMDTPGQRYVVFFPEWSAQLDPAASGSIAGAAARAKRHPGQPVIVTGFADLTGSVQANQDISGLRAQVVVDALVADGVPAGDIQKQAAGSVDYALNSQESRRVEILVGAP